MNDHGIIPWTLFTRGAAPACKCGWTSPDRYRAGVLLTEHLAEHGIRQYEDHGQIITEAI